MLDNLSQDTSLQDTFLALAREYDTPLYVYDLSRIERNFLSFKEAFGGRKSLICYALKANSNLGILSTLARLGSGADCVSIGEVKRALLAGIPKYKIIFSGVGKRAEEIEEALKLDILFLNVESSAELKTIEQIAKKLSNSQNPQQHLQQSPHQTDSSPSSPKKARISIRVNPNIDAKTHPYISTGLSENKFGLDIESAKQAYLYAHNSPFLDPVGIHFHIGSQICELAPIAQSAQKIANLAKSLLALGIEIRFFDIGGGLGIRYEEEEEIALYDYAQAILSALKGSDFTIICEPGRRIVGNAGVLLTKVLYEKRTANKRFVIVDSGMNDLMRPALYDAVHKVQVYSKASDKSNDKSSDKSNDKKSTKADIVGPVCESSDTFLREVELGELKQGDILGFGNAGAYGYSMASNYNTRAKPAEVGIYQKDSATQIVLLKKRETFSELVANELECLKDFAKGAKSSAKSSAKTKSSLERALDFENLSNFSNLSNADSSKDSTHIKKSKKSTKTQKNTKSTK